MGISTFTSKDFVLFCRVSKIGNENKPHQPPIVGSSLFFASLLRGFTVSPNGDDPTDRDQSPKTSCGGNDLIQNTNLPRVFIYI